jgi:aldehyde:ferredoxin oxidoreductase
MKILRVELTTKTISNEAVPEKYQDLGGRGLTSTFVGDEVSAICDPLGPENKLIFAPGYLTETPLINTSRLSVGAKSPLTGGIKESNAGGTVATDLAKLGFKAVIIEGSNPAQETSLLKIEADGSAQLLDAADYYGKRTYETVAKMKETFGEDYSITLIGPAGEYQLSSASIQTTDRDGKPCRAAGRGGLGAVMGSKGFKALVVSRKGKSPITLVDKDLFREASKKYAKAVKDDEFSGETLAEFGSAVLVEPINAAGGFPTKNATLGQFEHVDKISGETMTRIMKERGGQPTHKGCAKCIIDCSNVYVDQQGKYMTSSLEYETIWSMGGMLGNDDLDAIAKLDFLCDDIGLDTMNTGVAIAVAMDAGYREFGDGQAAIELLEEVAKGTEFGKILGNGPVAVGNHLNHDRVPAVKGQSIAAYDPRAIQGMAVTYATSPMGGDHTAGWVVDQNLEDFGGTIDPLKPDGQMEASRDAQIHMSMVDSMGICDFAQSGLAGEDGIEIVYQMISAKNGKPFSGDDWVLRGQHILKTEREFNRKAGFTNKDDRLPDFFYKEPLPPHNEVVLVSDEDMDRVFDFEKEI